MSDVVDKESAKDVAVTATVGVGATAAGLIGAVPALIGAAGGPLLLAIWKRWHANADLFTQILVDLTRLSPDELAAWAADEEGRSYLLMSAFQAAVASRVQQKTRALAHLVAEGVFDDAKIDYNAEMVEALSHLRGPHYQVLSVIAGDIEDKPPSPSGAPVARHAWLTSQLAARLPHLAPAIIPVATVLVRTGMASQPAVWESHDNASWMLTEFGRDCLAHLERLERIKD